MVSMTWTWQGGDRVSKNTQATCKGQATEESERTYMGHFASEIDIRIDARKHRTTRPRTDRNRSYLVWNHRSSDVDFAHEYGKRHAA